jgi:hypothetical protein
VTGALLIVENAPGTPNRFALDTTGLLHLKVR